jgi:hypothetical protein
MDEPDRRLTGVHIRCDAESFEGGLDIQRAIIDVR